MKILYTLVFAIFAFTLQAQTTKLLSLHGGPKLGGNFLILDNEVWFSDKLSQSSKSASGYAGAFLELSIGKHFAIQTEGLVSQFAYQWTLDPFTIVEKYSFTSFPVIAKFRMGGFALYGGYQLDKFNFAERKMHQYGSDPYTLDRIYEYDWHSANSMYVKNANALVAGVEYTMRVGVGISARYVKGLTNIVVSDRHRSVYDNGDELYNTYFSVGAHWSFGKRREKRI